MSLIRIVVVAILVLAACAPKGEEAAGDSATDSTAMGSMDSSGAAGMTDTTAMMTSPPTNLRDSAAAAAKGTSLGTPAAKTGTIGRDSAFGPTFTVDSTGKLIPINPKKP